MSPQQIATVQNTFAQLAPIAAAVPELFYDRLFEIDPSLRALFKSDIAEQGQKLMQMIALAVRSLDQPDTLLPAVRELGVRHRRYGVKAEDYDTVGEALLWTLEKGLGADFTPEVKQAWTDTYVLLAQTMQGSEKQAA